MFFVALECDTLFDHLKIEIPEEELEYARKYAPEEKVCIFRHYYVINNNIQDD